MPLGPRAVVAIAVFSLLGCSTFDVEQDFDPTANFASLRTFSWYPAPQARTGDLRLDHPQLDQRIREDVEQILVGRGYRRVDGRRPDFFVAYHLSLDQETDVQSVNERYGWTRYSPGRGAVGRTTRTRVDHYDRGTLVIDVSDALLEKLVWRGWTSSRIAAAPDPDQMAERVDAAVAEILAHFPPSTGAQP